MGAQLGLCAVLALTLLMCMPRIAETILLTIFKALVTGAYQVLFIYTPEVYPTTVRAIGLGTCVSAARVGGMIAPYISILIMQIRGIGPWIAYCTRL